LKFASKKEVRDRLKEFDAPALSNYIDPETIDKIMAAKKPPRGAKSTNVNKKKVMDVNAAEEHQQRI
jgi:hypothetical protein